VLKNLRFLAYRKSSICKYSHRSFKTKKAVKDLGIVLVFLPPYSPDPKSDRVHLEEHKEGIVIDLFDVQGRDQTSC